MLSTTQGAGEPHALLPTRKVRARYGGITERTIYRWLKNPELGFPQPLVINGRRYWKPEDLEAFDARAS